MRAPFRLIEPERTGVSIFTRGARASAASRETGPPAGIGAVPGAGAAGPPSFGEGEGTPSGVTPGGCVCA